jgi:sporulation protein YlmC with PRC-barrel domain
MLYNASALAGYALHATDGEIGSVEDFYFDDKAWIIRYLVADTGKWLPGRKVLLSPLSLGAVHLDGKKLDVKLTKDQVENSPDIDTHKPISRQNEIRFYNYYSYPYYWSGPSAWGPIALPSQLPEIQPHMPKAEQREILSESETEAEDYHLRSVSEIAGYYIKASDGEVGHVEDVLVDDKSWAVRYIVVDTKNWWPGRKVLVSPEWIKEVSWNDSSVYIDLARDAIETSPEYDSSAPIGEEYERRLCGHYGKLKS